MAGDTDLTHVVPVAGDTDLTHVRPMAGDTDLTHIIPWLVTLTLHTSSRGW